MKATPRIVSPKATGCPAPDGTSVLIVSDQFPPVRGGIGDYTALLADALVERGVRASLFVRKGSDPAACRAPIAGTFDCWSWAAASELHRAIIATNAEWVHLQHNGGMYKSCRLAAYFLPRYLRWKRWPGNIAVTFHDINRPFLFPRAGRVRDWVLGDLARNAGLVIAADTSDEAVLRSFGAAVHHVPIGSNMPVSRATPAEIAAIRNRYRINPSAVVVGHFGTASGLETLFDAVASLPDVILLLVGKTPDRGNPGCINILSDSMHERIVRLQLGPRVRWTTHLADHEVADTLASCDVLVLPYARGASMRHGGLLACLAQGRPVITTAPPKPMPGFTVGESFLATPPGDVPALTEAIQEVSYSETIRHRLSLGASQARHVFSWDHIADVHCRLYSDVARCSAA
jgi:glycosyltransferase involved in cell wall biosynthesis